MQRKSILHISRSKNNPKEICRQTQNKLVMSNTLSGKFYGKDKGKAVYDLK
jgi:hypothetical protein